MALKNAPAREPKIAPNGLPYLDDVTMRDVKIVMRNLSGAAGRYNKEGDRNFLLLLEQEDADRLARLGWNVREMKPREGEERGTLHIKVAAYYPTKDRPNTRPPRIVLVTGRQQVELDGNTVGMLDRAHIKKVDIVFRDWPWGEKGGDRGHKAVVKTMYVTIVEDELDREYREMPEEAFLNPEDEWGGA